MNARINVQLNDFMFCFKLSLESYGKEEKINGICAWKAGWRGIPFYLLLEIVLGSNILNDHMYHVT
jgi:hypothetical protein